MPARRARREYTEDFRRQMVQLYNSGKPTSEIIREYDLTPSAFGNWVKRINATGSSKVTLNRGPAELRLITLEKENKQLRMENDVLKQAALIFARRS